MKKLFSKVLQFGKKKNFWTVLQFLNTNRMGFVEFWKIIPDFEQEKEL